MREYVTIRRTGKYKFIFTLESKQKLNYDFFFQHNIFRSGQTLIDNGAVS
jgi:hypothetical protein